jgi:hypothetical protein
MEWMSSHSEASCIKKSGEKGLSVTLSFMKTRPLNPPVGDFKELCFNKIF